MRTIIDYSGAVKLANAIFTRKVLTTLKNSKNVHRAVVYRLQLWLTRISVYDPSRMRIFPATEFQRRFSERLKIYFPQRQEAISRQLRLKTRQEVFEV